MFKTEKQKMLGGDLYNAGDPEIQSDQAAAREWMVRYNAALGVDQLQRRMLLAERPAHVGGIHCAPAFPLRLWIQHLARSGRVPQLRLRHSGRCECDDRRWTQMGQTYRS